MARARSRSRQTLNSGLRARATAGRRWRVRRRDCCFSVGEFKPEIIEQEIDGDSAKKCKPVVTAPHDQRPRIFPRQNIDVVDGNAKEKCQTVSCEVFAARLRLRCLTHCSENPRSARPCVIARKRPRRRSAPIRLIGFTAASRDGLASGTHPRCQFQGRGQAYVYRLTLTTGPYRDASFRWGRWGGERTSACTRAGAGCRNCTTEAV